MNTEVLQPEQKEEKFRIYFEVDHPLVPPGVQTVIVSEEQFKLIKQLGGGLHVYNVGDEDNPELEVPQSGMEMRQAPIYIPRHKIQAIQDFNFAPSEDVGEEPDWREPPIPSDDDKEKKEYDITFTSKHPYFDGQQTIHVNDDQMQDMDVGDGIPFRNLGTDDAPDMVLSNRKFAEVIIPRHKVDVIVETTY